MATGIVSVALAAAGSEPLSLAFLALACLGYLELLLVQGRRMLTNPAGARSELLLPAVALGALTFPVGTEVLATRFQLAQLHWVAAILFWVGTLAAGLALAGLPFALAGGARRGHQLWQGGGLWMLWTVCLQSVAVASAELAAVERALPLSSLSTALFAFGAALYLPLAVAVMVLVAAERPPLSRVGPSFWVLSGAASISALAAAELHRLAGGGLQIPGTALAGLGLGFWIAATAWLPWLLALSGWRLLHHSELRGPRQLFVAVFPVGMYAAASLALGTALRLGWLSVAGHGLVWCAVAAWLADLLRGVGLRLLPLPQEPG